MKRTLFVVFTFFSLLPILSQSKDFSRWSIAPEYGYNFFDGDINQSLTNIFPTSFRDITFGGTIEYAFTPIWGLSVDGHYFPLRAVNNSPVKLAINTDLYTADLNATINFTRLIFPNTKSKFYFLGSIGLGFAYYSFDIRDYTTNLPIPDNATYNDTKYNGNVRPIHLFDNNTGGSLQYGLAASCPVTFSFEYNFSKPIAVGAKLHYRAYTKDNLEGVTYLNWDGVTNDFIAAGTIYLRLKFNSLQKNHLRNIGYDIYEPDQALVLAKELEGKLNKLTAKVDTIGAKVDSIMPRLARLESLLSNDGPDSDGDGVPDVRDKEVNTSTNTPVDFWGKTLKINGNNFQEPDLKNQGKGKGVYVGEDIPAVYFDFDQIDLDDAALIAISKIATKMKSDTTLYVEVRGYCDYMGNNPYNNLLSQRRSDRVKAELVKVWQIPFDHIISNGKGKVIEPRVKYRPNRRCDFFFGRL